MGKQRKYIEKSCLDCLVIRKVRSDSTSIRCSPCRARKNHLLRKPKDMINQRFGKLLVLSFSHIAHGAYWLCLCDCGNTKVLYGARLRTGKTKSCGCMASKQKKLSASSTYSSWRSMVQRCYDARLPHFKRYGAKGITVCDEWRNSFAKFLEDMGHRLPGTSLDRIDSNLGYFKENCRWSDKYQQNNNRQNSVFIEAFGKRQTMAQWARELNINPTTIRKRYLIAKWTVEKVLMKKNKSK